MKCIYRTLVLTAMLTTSLVPAYADQQPSPVQNALRDVVSNGPDAETKAVANDLLKALQINTGPDLSTTRPDRSISPKAGMAQSVEMRIGETRTVEFPSAIDKTLLVIPDFADVIVIGDTKVQILARAAGSTDVVFVAKSGESYKLRLVVTASIEAAQRAIHDSLPNENFKVSAANSALILSGTTRDAAAVASAMNILRRYVLDPQNAINEVQVLGAQQVMLRVRVAEVNRTVLKQLGLETAIANNPGKTATAVIGSNPSLAQYGVNSPVSSGGTNPNTLGGAQPFTALGTATNPVGFLSTKALGSVFTTVANALESEGLVRIISEPNLVTLTGKTASLNALTEYPIPTLSQTGLVGTQYHNFGVSLGFTPTVSSPGSISLDISTEVSTKGDNVTFPNGSGGTFTTPSFTTRKANSTVELPSGGSIVIAGLISNDLENTIAGVPGLKDLPIFGKLFGSTDFQRHETELVVSVTAYLVQPVDGNKLSDPGQGLIPPSDTDLYLLNKLTGASHRRLNAPPTGVEQLFGYILE